MLKTAALLFLLLVQMAHSEFLAAQENGKITVLCEGQEAVFISGPSVQAKRVALDSDFQAIFAPENPGIYSVQCGKEAKTLAVTGQAAAAAQAESYDAWAAAFVAFFILSFAAAALCIFWLFVRGRTEFSKAVAGGRAAVTLRFGRRLENLELEDPLSFGHEKPVRFSLPFLEAGKKWDLEYDTGDGETALPASLRAICDGNEISLLSELRIETRGSTVPGNAPAQKRKLARA